MRRVITVLLICVLATVAGVSGFKIYQTLTEYHAGENTYDDLKQYATVPESDSEADGETDAGPKQNVIDFASLFDINSDIVAWIRLDDSVIDYPVAQRDGDNDYYLTHLFDGEVNSSGCIFLDCRSSADFSDSNSVIYGHHMKNGSMFSAITNYKSREFFEEHPAFDLYTPEHSYKVEVFAGYVADLQDAAWDTYFEDVEEFEDWIQERKAKSLFDSGIMPTAGDKILTLSTCSYEFDNARFVVFGVIHEAN